MNLQSSSLWSGRNTRSLIKEWTTVHIASPRRHNALYFAAGHEIDSCIIPDVPSFFISVCNFGVISNERPSRQLSSEGVATRSFIGDGV